MSKNAKMRDLICAGLNKIIEMKIINLYNQDDVQGSIRLNLLGKDTKISWRGVGYGELRVTVWWGVKPACKDSESAKPLNRNLRDAADVCCSGWLERKNKTWLQGRGGKPMAFTYCANAAYEDLMAVPSIYPCSVSKESGQIR